MSTSDLPSASADTLSGADGSEAVAVGIERVLDVVHAEHDGQWKVAVGTAGHDDPADDSWIVDLGNGLCFRR